MSPRNWKVLELTISGTILRATVCPLALGVNLQSLEPAGTFERVKRLRESGLSVAAIALQLGIGKGTPSRVIYGLRC